MRTTSDSASFFSISDPADLSPLFRQWLTTGCLLLYLATQQKHQPASKSIHLNSIIHGQWPFIILLSEPFNADANHSPPQYYTPDQKHTYSTMSNIAGDARHPLRYSLQTDPSTLLLPLPYSSRHWLAMTLLRGSCRTTANGSRDNINLNKNRQGWFLFVIRCSALYYSSVFIMLSSTSSCPFFILYKDLHS